MARTMRKPYSNPEVFHQYMGCNLVELRKRLDELQNPHYAISRQPDTAARIAFIHREMLILHHREPVHGSP